MLALLIEAAEYLHFDSNRRKRYNVHKRRNKMILLLVFQND